MCTTCLHPVAWHNQYELLNDYGCRRENCECVKLTQYIPEHMKGLI